MKKMFFLLVVVFCFSTNITLGQLMLSPNQVYKTIYGPDNLSNINNQDLIHPGDTLHYLLLGVLPTSFIIKEGDNQSELLSKYIFSEKDLYIAKLSKELLDIKYQMSASPKETKKDNTLDDVTILILVVISLTLIIRLIILTSRKNN